MPGKGEVTVNVHSPSLVVLLSDQGPALSVTVAPLIGAPVVSAVTFIVTTVVTETRMVPGVTVTVIFGSSTVTSASYQSAFISFSLVLTSFPLEIFNVLLSPLFPFTSNSISARYPAPLAPSAADRLEITVIMSESVKFHV